MIFFFFIDIYQVLFKLWTDSQTDISKDRVFSPGTFLSSSSWCSFAAYNNFILLSSQCFPKPCVLVPLTVLLVFTSLLHIPIVRSYIIVRRPCLIPETDTQPLSRDKLCLRLRELADNNL